MRLAIINGPNLNLVGIREKHIYGSMTMDHFLDTLAEAYPDIDIVTFQSNVEGELVNDIQEVGFVVDGIILNAGAMPQFAYHFHIVGHPFLQAFGFEWAAFVFKPLYLLVKVVLYFVDGT